MDKRDERGRFMPGCSSDGRPKGSKNKATAAVREKFQQLVDSYSVEQMKLDLMELEPGERLRVISGLLDFFMPKLNRTDHSMTIGDETIIIQLPSYAEAPEGKATIKNNDNRLLESEDIQPGLPASSE